MTNEEYARHVGDGSAGAERLLGQVELGGEALDEVALAGERERRAACEELDVAGFAAPGAE